MVNQFPNSKALNSLLIKAAGLKESHVHSIQTVAESGGPVMFQVVLIGQEELIGQALEDYIKGCQEEEKPSDMRGTNLPSGDPRKVKS